MKNLLLKTLLLFATLNLYGQSQPPYSIGKQHIIYSKILNENRQIYIHQPQGFWGLDEDQKNFPVTFVLDGESQFLTTVAALDFLSAAPNGNDLMPRTIVVGIPNTNRNRDLTPTKGIMGNDSTMLETTGGGKKFLAFITDELTPYIDSLYSTSNHRTLIGHSLGGLLVLEALLNKSEHFNNYLAIDPALNYDNESYFNLVMDGLRKTNLKEENLYLAKANIFLDIENKDEDKSDIMKLVQTNRKFEKLANSENWNLNYSFVDYPDENHFSIPYKATYDAIKFFYDYYQFKEMIHYYHPSYQDKSDLVEKLKKHYEMISEKLGYETIPMESYINSWAYGISEFGRNDLALDLFDYNIELYPNRPSVFNTKGFFLERQQKIEEAIKLFELSLLIQEDDFIRERIEELEDQ